MPLSGRMRFGLALDVSISSKLFQVLYRVRRDGVKENRKFGSFEAVTKLVPSAGYFRLSFSHNLCCGPISGVAARLKQCLFHRYPSKSGYESDLFSEGRFRPDRRGCIYSAIRSRRTGSTIKSKALMVSKARRMIGSDTGSTVITNDTLSLGR